MRQKVLRASTIQAQHTPELVGKTEITITKTPHGERDTARSGAYRETEYSAGAGRRFWSAAMPSASISLMSAAGGSRPTSTTSFQITF